MALYSSLPPIQMPSGDLFVKGMTVESSYRGETSLNIDIIMGDADSHGFYQMMRDAMMSGNKFPIGWSRMYQQEFLCIWCGSVNPIEHTHCSKCGGPRGLIMRDGGVRDERSL